VAVGTILVFQYQTLVLPVEFHSPSLSPFVISTSQSPPFGQFCSRILHLSGEPWMLSQ
jgi:hypothetical protein